MKSFSVIFYLVGGICMIVGFVQMFSGDKGPTIFQQSASGIYSTAWLIAALCFFVLAGTMSIIRAIQNSQPVVTVSNTKEKRKCPKCSAMIDADLASCPSCGKTF